MWHNAEKCRRKQEKKKNMAEYFTEAVEAQALDLPAGRFHYLGWGAERAELPAAVLLPGIKGSRPSRGLVGSALAGRYRAYAFASRGPWRPRHPVAVGSG